MIKEVTVKIFVLLTSIVDVIGFLEELLVHERETTRSRIHLLRLLVARLRQLYTFVSHNSGIETTKTLQNFINTSLFEKKRLLDAKHLHTWKVRKCYSNTCFLVARGGIHQLQFPNDIKQDLRCVFHSLQASALIISMILVR